MTVYTKIFTPSKTLETKAQALRYEAWIKNNKTITPEGEPKTKYDGRKLSELIEIWHEKHGQYLKSGKNRRLMLNNLYKHLKNPVGEQLTAGDFAVYRNERLGAGISKNMVNNEQTYLSALFNELIRLGEWTKDNPLKNIRQLKLDDKELDFLDQAQIKELLDKLKKSTESDCYCIAKICLATGARWSEAENLMDTDIKNNSITYRAAKNGKNRTVPISKNFIESIPIKEGRLFKYSYSTLKRRIKKVSFQLTERAVKPCFSAYFRFAFYYERRQYPGAAKNTGTRQFIDDYALCPSCTRSSGRNDKA